VAEREWPYLGWLFQRDVDFQTLDQELELPEVDDDEYDEYAVRSDRLRLWAQNIDERPEWERTVGGDLDTCQRCTQRDVLDPWGTCLGCRLGAGWCGWCGLDKPAYRKLNACRTCYRWLRRHLDVEPAEAAVALLAQAARRKANRERRES
jgi:hypothetical protein